VIKNQLDNRKKLKHYNIPNHAHELTFSCYRRMDYLNDPVICKIFIEELGKAKEKLHFKIWAYVLMSNHVHLLLFPENEFYNISNILQHMKGKTSSRYRQYILNYAPDRFDLFCVKSKGKKVFRIWQTGGGFDRNLWSAKAIHYSINYIEGNPVRAGLAETSEEWMWSSAWARLMKPGFVSDYYDIPVLMK